MSAFEEIDDYDEQLRELISQIGRTLETEVPDLAGTKRSEKLQYLKGRLDRTRQVYNSFKVELRELSKADARRYEEKAKEYGKQIVDLQSDWDRAKEFSEQARAMGGGDKRVEDMTTGEVLKLADKIQQESKKTTERGKQIVEETLDIGAATALTVKEQTEQLNRIDKQIEVVDSNVALAQKQLRAFMRRMATDKLVMTLVCLVLVGIIAAIVVGITQNPPVLPGPTVIPVNPTATPTVEP